jgi:DNA-binding PadR family transcriptional regulator
VILSLIEEQPRHGYEIIKAIEEKFQGTYAPSPGAVYPILSYLQDQEFVREDDQGTGSKRRYAITESGRAHVEENRIVVEGILTRAGITAQAFGHAGPPEEVHQAVETFRHALHLHRGEWTREEGLRVSQIIIRAAKDIADVKTPRG